MDIFSHRTLQSLYEAACMVLDQGQSPEVLRESLEELKQMVSFRESSAGQGLLDQARDRYANCFEGIDIDDGTFLYHDASDGYWVMAWCFVEESSQVDDAAELLNSDIEDPIYVPPDPMRKAST